MSTILDRERAIAEESFASAVPYEIADEYIHFPDNLVGKTVVDIGAGASDVSAVLRRVGSDPWAIDPRYGDIKGLRRSVDQFLTGRLNMVNDVAWQRGGPLREMMEGNKRYADCSRRAKDRFLWDYDKVRSSRYLEAYAGSIPLGDNFADFCFSLQCVSKFLIEDWEVFKNAVFEALRILKPGGQLKLQPWLGGTIDWNGVRVRNARELQRLLSREGIPFASESCTHMFTSPVLRITKP